tara:strand:- start:3269 stop:4051 length:783 start_codon:yes stop_codon:yes gene_type:complete
LKKIILSRFLNLIFICALFFHSCGSKKNIIYLQDLNIDSNHELAYNEYKVKPSDILKIDILSDDPELMLSLSPKAQINTQSNSKDNLLYNGYQVNSLGFINLQSIGNLKVEGLSVREITEIISTRLRTDGLLTNAYVDVKLLNSSFTIIGEVLRPGNYDFLDDNLNLLEAIGMAGDLTINGQRKDIRIIRFNNNKNNFYSVDLTNSEFLKDINLYQVIPGDIIIVNPNTTRVKNAGIIGNSGTLISLLTFILSSIIVISN